MESAVTANLYQTDANEYTPQAWLQALDAQSKRCSLRRCNIALVRR